MLFYNNLDKIIFTRNQFVKCDELIILSGYVGPTLVRELELLPIKSTVIYGMYGSDGIQKSLHEVLVEENQFHQDIEIYYSTVPIHSKCYIWKWKGDVVSALVGSANFSLNGLTTPYKEVLADATTDTFEPLKKYIEIVLNNSIKCENAVVSKNKKRLHYSIEDKEQFVYDKDVCSMPLYIIEKGNPIVPTRSGINWGMAKLNGTHVNINDAYIRIGADLLKNYPDLFPQKQISPSDEKEISRIGHRHNDNIEILWDDGTVMIGLLEGSSPKKINGKKELFPKQISTSPSKALLGKYLRNRIGIPEGQVITYEDLKKYGRTTIDVSLQGEGIYYFDFSVDNIKNTQYMLSKTSERHVAEDNQGYLHKTKMVYEDFYDGQKIYHSIYGDGVILRKKNSIITVAFSDKRIKLKYPDECEFVSVKIKE